MKASLGWTSVSFAPEQDNSFTIQDRMSDIILVYHESNEQRATRDPRDQADERNQGVGLFLIQPRNMILN